MTEDIARIAAELLFGDDEPINEALEAEAREWLAMQGEYLRNLRASSD